MGIIYEASRHFRERRGYSRLAKEVSGDLLAEFYNNLLRLKNY
jgi:hypothetical protein